MAVTPPWLAASAGQPTQSGQVNQFLGTHAIQYLYTGTERAAQIVNGSTHTSGNGIYMAQSFATAAGQTTIGYVIAPIGSFTNTGASLATTTLSLYANSGGAPTGAALAATTITTEYADSATGGTDTVNVFYPLPVTGLSASTTYWLVVAPAGNGTNHYTWRQSNQTSGASTSPDGVTWTAQTYGLQYQIYDQVLGINPSLLGIYEDVGARWTALTYSGIVIHTIAEYTAGQTATGYLQSYRTLTYSGTNLLKAA